MKKQLLPVTITLALLASCIEKGPIIVLDAEQKNDTTYVTTVESRQQHNVLLEESTGVSCANCPSGHAIIDSLRSDYGSRLYTIAYHPTGNSFTDPVDKNGIKSRQDFRSTKAKDINSDIFNGDKTMPSAAIDRIPEGSDMLLAKSKWSDRVMAGMSKTTPVNVTVKSSFDDANKEATIKVKIAFTEDVTKTLKYSVMIIEDEIVDAQKDGLDIIENYTHRHVMRDVLTVTTGSLLLSERPTKEKGLVYERTFSYKLPAGWNASNCKAISFVSNSESNDYGVLQVSGADIK